MNTNWNELTARERDGVVAERVMGWRRMTNAEYFQVDTSIACYQTEYWTALTNSWHAKDSNEKREDIDGECDCGQSHSNFSPSTDIAHAWLVVERMREKGYEFELMTADGWICSFENETHYRHANAPTESEAICLAACRALGVEV